MLNLPSVINEEYQPAFVHWTSFILYFTGRLINSDTNSNHVNGCHENYRHSPLTCQQAWSAPGYNALVWKYFFSCLLCLYPRVELRTLYIVSNTQKLNYFPLISRTRLFNCNMLAQNTNITTNNE